MHKPRPEDENSAVNINLSLNQNEVVIVLTHYALHSVNCTLALLMPPCKAPNYSLHGDNKPLCGYITHHHKWGETNKWDHKTHTPITVKNWMTARWRNTKEKQHHCSGFNRQTSTLHQLTYNRSADKFLFIDYLLWLLDLTLHRSANLH